MAREIIEFSKKTDMRIAVGVVYGKDSPPLLSPKPKVLAPPFRELCVRIRSQLKAGHLCQLVFDQRWAHRKESASPYAIIWPGWRHRIAFFPTP